MLIIFCIRDRPTDTDEKTFPSHALLYITYLPNTMYATSASSCTQCTPMYSTNGIFYDAMYSHFILYTHSFPFLCIYINIFNLWICPIYLSHIYSEFSAHKTSQNKNSAQVRSRTQKNLSNNSRVFRLPLV